MIIIIRNIQEEPVTLSLGSSAVLSRCPSRALPVEAIARPKLFNACPRSEELSAARVQGSRGKVSRFKEEFEKILKSISLV
jgi:hypothetical protein